MRLVPLHNALLSLSRWTNASAAAAKLIPYARTQWQPASVAVGDTSALLEFGWGGEREQPIMGTPIALQLWGLPNLEFYQNPGESEQTNLTWRVQLTRDLLNAMPGQFKLSNQREGSDTLLGEMWISIIVETNSISLNFAKADLPPQFEMLLGACAQMAWGLYSSEQIGRDPISGLPGAAEFRAHLEGILLQQKPAAVLLLGLDDYPRLRREQGQEVAERLMSVAAECTAKKLRQADRLFYYREAQIILVLQIEDIDACDLVAKKLLKHLIEEGSDNPREIEEANIGYFFIDPDHTSQLDVQSVCMSAEQALDRARLMSSSQVVSFTGDFDSDLYTASRPLGSLVVGDPAKEYRNNQILWQTVSLVANEHEEHAFCNKLVNVLASALSANSVDLLRLDDADIRFLASSSQAHNMQAAQQRLIKQCIEQSKTLVHHDETQQEYWLATHQAGLTGLDCCLFISANETIDAGDQVFFKAILDQVVGALDRGIWVRNSNRFADQESTTDISVGQGTRSRSDLSNQLTKSDAPAMQHVFDLAARIAPTDVSVLINGESGAGKEVIARLIHNQSERAHAPFVTVDCSAISHTLIDSELFGRVKGAYTGADRDAIGRIAQAQGGTLFLDEIGELPLEVQAKLLRFVQEREIVAVGDTQPKYVETRIICATNRDLQAEVHAGTFRADLFYRLQVVQLIIPPLRERAEDLHLLVNLLLEGFTQQLKQPVKALSPAAWRKLQSHSWPGNVRELQNTLLRASLLSEGDLIDAQDIHLGTSLVPPARGSEGVEPTPTPLAAPAKLMTPSPVSQQAPTNQPDTSSAWTLQNANTQDEWDILASFLAGQLSALQEDNLMDAPIGRWLHDALVTCAYEQAGEVMRGAAALIGLPETTFRRQLSGAQRAMDNPLTSTTQQWQTSLPALKQLFHQIFTTHNSSQDLLECIERTLISQIVDTLPNNSKAGAALLGVTPATFKRRLNKHQLNASSPRVRDLEMQHGQLP